MKQNLYTYSAVLDIINKYTEKYNGNYVNIEEGCLGEGLSVLFAEGKKTVVIKEVYLNDSSSAHSITFYNKMPAKYSKLINSII